MKLDNLECRYFFLCLRVWNWILVELWLCWNRIAMRGLLWLLFLVEVIVRISHSICILVFPVIAGLCSIHSFFLLDYGWFMLHSIFFFLLDYDCLISISVVIWLSWCIFCVNYILLHFLMFSLCLHVVWYLNLRGNASYIMCLTRVVISCFSRFFFWFVVAW